MARSYPHIWMEPYCTQLIFDFFRRPNVVLIKKGDPLCVSRSDAGVASRRNSSIRLSNHHRAETFSDCCRAVRGAVIYDDDLGYRKRLSTHALDNLDNEDFSVICRDYY